MLICKWRFRILKRFSYQDGFGSSTLRHPRSPFMCKECSDCKTIFPRRHYQELALLESQVCLSNPPAPLLSVPLRHYSSLCFYKLVVVSAWVWQQLDVPCFCPMPFLLHSHSMTSVKRASSFHENSHSTRTRSRVSRKPVILNVSRFWR